MSRFNLLLLLFLLGGGWGGEREDRFYHYFKSGLRDYKIGSYYDALNEFNHLAKYPDNPYYLDSLKYLAKTYLQIGKRTGEKKYLWTAQKILNTYLSKGGVKDADYYYTKASIFEVLGFYERALANYKIALPLAHKRSTQLQIVIGILRSAVWLKKLDVATRYIVILNIESLSKSQMKEFQFLKGMYHFVKGEYDRALQYLRKSYREYENFLIENPQYYYIVAENAYRLGDLDFAERLFRRILNYIKNRDVIQKSLLRLGDIKFLKNQIRESTSYYYRLIREFPTTDYATVARLKILYLMGEDRELAYYIKKFLPDAPFLEHPQEFVVRTLVANRNNYVGFFALANFGEIVFNLRSEKLLKRLSWELSLLSVKRLQFEHKEYFRRVWNRFLPELPERWVCQLYTANPDLFFTLFRERELLIVADRLSRCGDRKRYKEFLERLAESYPKRELFLKVVEALFHQGEYREARSYLERVRPVDCSVYRWRARICFMEGGRCSKEFKEYITRCNQNPFERELFRTLLKGEVGSDFIRANVKLFEELYFKDPLVRRYTEITVGKLLDADRYGDLIALLAPLSRSIKDCSLKSILALSYVRSGKIALASQIVERLSDCDSPWYQIAINAIKNSQLQEEVQNVGKDR
ncbi:MAG: hypothetical protein GXO19_04085 [Epsilonproteobacteria bacterium]|nr:hypothetical protein [Campylobacterota bacterium]NPA56901.1 hypothetical protein [Campylobacterota bacterium]